MYSPYNMMERASAGAHLFDSFIEQIGNDQAPGKVDV